MNKLYKTLSHDVCELINHSNIIVLLTDVKLTSNAFSFAALTYATRYTIAANISLLMLLETILGPVWVWFFLKETPGIQMVMGGIIVIFSLGIYFLKLQRD